MPRIRIPMSEWTKAGAKNKANFIPEGQKDVKMIFATDVIFIDTEWLPGYGPEPKPEPEPVPEEEAPPEEKPVEPGEKTPDTSWPKKKLIKFAKKLNIYDPKMKDRKHTKAKIVEAIKKSL